MDTVDVHLTNVAIQKTAPDYDAEKVNTRDKQSGNISYLLTSIRSQILSEVSFFHECNFQIQQKMIFVVAKLASTHCIVE